MGSCLCLHEYLMKFYFKVLSLVGHSFEMALDLQESLLILQDFLVLGSFSLLSCLIESAVNLLEKS